ncbi:MAG: HlyC/CorC family transporter [Sedimentisphaerales bacterium]|nr:HlyC/CorC family transporter [Sedimentisphaerales bacterium]
MVILYNNLIYIILMLALLGCSAFFSGTETAFFSLSRSLIKTMKQSKYKRQHLVVRLLDRPEQLLGSLLLGNLIVNVLFFATASVLAIRFEQQISLTAAAIVAFVTLIVLIFCGEILPKYLSYNNAKLISIISALPVLLVVRLFSPIVTFFRIIVVKPLLRIFLGSEKNPKTICPDEFKILIEAAKQRGLISTHQNKILTELLEFGFLKVRHIMRPRVDMVACSIQDQPEEARQIMVKNHLTKLPVYSGKVDNIVGLIQHRELLLNPDFSLDRLTNKIDFVPEQKSVESLLEFFRKGHTDMAVVVDEYGGVAGSVYLEDIAEELLGPIEISDEVDLVEQIGPYEYRLAGYLSIFDWIKEFGMKPVGTKVATLGGFVTALLGKIPKKGDVVSWKNLTFTIEQVRGHRVETVLLTIKPVKENVD